MDDVENKEFLKKLLESMYGELPAPKKKKQKQKNALYFPWIPF